jgi:peptidoglycan/LPS O-acetylase OafA/YrhL
MAKRSKSSSIFAGPRAERNHQLDGLRGYAAVAVAVFHTILV